MKLIVNSHLKIPARTAGAILTIGTAALALSCASLSLRAQSASSGSIITVAGNGTSGPSGDGGPATNAALAGPVALAVGRDGTLYCHDIYDALSAGNFRAVNPTNGIISTIASGSANPVIGVDPLRHRLYFPDFDDDVVLQINLSNNAVTPFAGVGWSYPFPLDGTGNRGDGGPASGAWFSSSPYAVVVDGAGNVFIAEGSRIRKVTIATGIITTICGVKNPCCDGLIDISASSGDGGPATNAALTFPVRIAADRAGNVFILDIQGSSSTGCRVRRIDAATGIINTIAGAGTNSPVTAGPAASVGLTNLQAIAVNDAGTELFLGEISRVYRIDLTTGILSPYAGNGTNGFSGDGGPALSARFGSDGVQSLAVAPGGGLLLSDHGNLRIRYVVPNSITLTDSPGQSEFHLPWVSSLNGDLIITNNPNLTVVDGHSLTNVAGSVIINASSNAISSSIDLSSLMTVGGSIDVNAGNGQLGGFLDFGSLTNVCGDITLTVNATNATVDLNSLTSFGGCGTNTVTVTVGGTVMVTNGIAIQTNATLAGSATLNGSVTNNGTIAPGQLAITGNLILNNSSALKLEIGGYAPGQFDSITVSGALSLNGTLTVSLINDFPSVMTNGASFTVVSAGTLTGAFANIASGGTLTTTDGYARFTVLYAGTNTVRLTDLAIVDTDGDGMPDWWEDRFNFNRNSAADALLDADGDGAVNLHEFRAGTDPRNAASVFRITNIQRETNGVRITWSTVGGKSYRLQTNNALAQPFGEFGPLIFAPGMGESTTNLLDADSASISNRYYRVRLVP